MLRDILGNDTTFFLSFFLPIRLNLRGGHQMGFGIQCLFKKKKKKTARTNHINDFEFLVILLHLELVDCENALYRYIPGVILY